MPGEVEPTPHALLQAAVEQSREKYKRFKRLENKDPETYLVCKFDNGQFARMIIRHVGPAPEGADTAENESIEEKTENRKNSCQRKYGGTWEAEDPK